MTDENKSNDEIILSHYKNVAKNHQLSKQSSIQDPFIRDVETKFVIDFLKDELNKNKEKSGPFKVLDAGCGNGYLLSQIRKKFKDIKLYGIEFSPDLLKLGKSRKIPDCQIVAGDLREKIPFKEKFNLIITERVIINILDFKEQRKALMNLKSSMLDSGHYIQIESHFEPLVKLNRARKEMGLTPLEQSEHNKYINKYMLGFMRDKLGFKKVKTETPENYLSTYFFLSRVFHQVVRPKGAKVKYSHMVDFLTEGIGPGVGDYSPILLNLFRLG